jgi:pSer/pThr/pTyr-binding forkhead associated (FHA) protein
MAQYQLVLRVGPSPGKVFPLMKNEVTIGRDINNEIVINDAEISRKHCRLIMFGDSFAIEDLGSTNGTWVNERRITSQHQLTNGETIRLGDNITLSFEMVGFDADATIASSSAPPPPQQQAAPPRQQYEQPPVQQYAPPAQPAAKPKILGMPRGLFIILLLLLMAICVFAALWWYIDANELYCNVVPFLFGSACP